jgi:hypothetical protein
MPSLSSRDYVQNIEFLMRNNGLRQGLVRKMRGVKSPAKNANALNLAQAL